MSMQPGGKASAQVVLRSAAGEAPGPAEAIVAANVAQFLPAPDTAAAVQHAVREGGFETGGVAGNSFSITGPTTNRSMCSIESTFVLKSAW